jgi:hypothetical protein
MHRHSFLSRHQCYAFSVVTYFHYCWLSKLVTSYMYLSCSAEEWENLSHSHFLYKYRHTHTHTHTVTHTHTHACTCMFTHTHTHTPFSGFQKKRKLTTLRNNVHYTLGRRYWHYFKIQCFLVLIRTTILQLLMHVSWGMHIVHDVQLWEKEERIMQSCFQLF